MKRLLTAASAVALLALPACMMNQDTTGALGGGSPTGPTQMTPTAPAQPTTAMGVQARRLQMLEEEPTRTPPRRR